MNLSKRLVNAPSPLQMGLFNFMKSVKWKINWRQPCTDITITSTYVLPVPKGITPSYYLWIANGRKIPYKNQCFINRLKSINQ